MNTGLRLHWIPAAMAGHMAWDRDLYEIAQLKRAGKAAAEQVVDRTLEQAEGSQ